MSQILAIKSLNDLIFSYLIFDKNYFFIVLNLVGLFSVSQILALRIKPLNDFMFNVYREENGSNPFVNKKVNK